MQRLCSKAHKKLISSRIPVARAVSRIGVNLGVVCSLFKKDASLEKYCLSQVQPHPIPIHVCLGLRDQTLSKIHLERFITDFRNQLDIPIISGETVFVRQSKNIRH